MKHLLIPIAILLWVVFPLATQTPRGNRIVVYIQPVTGGAPEDNVYITNLLTVETRAYNFLIANNRDEADFSFIATLTPEISQPGGNPAGIFDLSIMFIDNRTREIISEQHLLYSSSVRNMLDNFFQFLVFRMIATIVPQDVEHDIAVVSRPSDEWRNRHWYFSGYIAWAPRAYISEYESAFFPNACIGFAVEYHFLNRFSVEAGVAITADWVVMDPANRSDYRDLMLEIPFSFRYVIKPSTHFMLEPYAGIIFNLSLYSTIKPPPMSWMLGFQYGVRAGPGIIIVDPRFSMDITKSRLNEIHGRETEFDRIKMYVGIGYKFSFNR